MKATQVAKDFDLRVELAYRWLHDTRAKSQEELAESKTSEEIKRLKEHPADVGGAGYTKTCLPAGRKAMGIFAKPPKQNSHS